MSSKKIDVLVRLFDTIVSRSSDDPSKSYTARLISEGKEKCIEKLKEDIEKDNLPSTSGFFFGSSEGLLKKNDLEKANTMLDALSKGSLIYYISSW